MLESIIRKRKSIRQFDNQTVDIKEIIEILEIARFAPSGKNRQPWKVKIIDKSDKATLIKLLRDTFSNENLPGSLEITLGALEQCDKVILFFNPYSYREDDYSRNKLLMDTQSLGALIQNFLLLSTERGIATLWINDVYFAKNEIERVFADSRFEIIAAVAVGYSSIIRTYDIRKDLDEILL
ncbi:MAG TPA: nitroreductase family protein [Spirochaetota bacterium]|nr:nitroreductase family protein [Spirochaetota bacterium]